MPNRAAGLDWDAEGEPAGARRGGRRSGPRARLTTQAIVDAAIRIADAGGLDAVTIRRVAAELDARPMSLYTHIAAKADLLALMANELMGQMIVDEPQPADWREALSEIARRMHAVFVAHPWALDAFIRRPRLGPNAQPHSKQLASAVSGLGLEQADVWTVLGIVNDYLIGHALRVPTAAQAPDIEQAMSAIDRTEFPEFDVLATSVERRVAGAGFEIGLQTILDGIEQRFLDRPAPRRATGHAQRPQASPRASKDRH